MIALDTAAVRAALNGIIGEVAEELLGPRNRSRSTRIDWRWGSRGSLSVKVGGAKRGRWYNHETGRGGDEFGLVAEARRCNFAEALQWTADRIGIRRDEGRRIIIEAPLPDGRDQRITKARKLWAESRPIAGSIAETYLTQVRGFAAPVEGWPEDLKFHPGSRSLILPGCTDAGDVQFVHLVRLTIQGDNARDGEGKKLKRTYGPKSGAAFRLPGTPGPVLHAEGGETAIAAWLATGHQTHCKFGPVAQSELVPGVLNVVLADDDPPGHPTETALAESLRRWRPGFEVAALYPWAERRHDKSDIADVLRQAGPEAVAARIAAVPPPATPSLPAYYPAPTEDRDTAKARQDAALNGHMAEGGRIVRARQELERRRAEAIAAAGEPVTPREKGSITRRLHREIAAREGWGRRIPLPPMQMFAGAQGTGKTTVARQFALTSPGLTTWITELTFEKLEEEFDAYRRAAGPDSPPAMLIRGRERFDPQRPGHFMCDRHQAAKRIAEADLEVPDLLCRSCEFRGKCGDHRQRAEAKALIAAGNGATFFLAAAYTFLQSPAPSPDHAILDESLLALAVARRAVSIADIAALSVPNIDTTSIDTAVTLRAIIDAFTVAHPTTPERVAAGDERIMPRPLAYLRHAGIDRKALRSLAKATRAEVERLTPAISAEMTDTDIEAALSWGNRGALRQLLALIAALQREIDLPREEATSIWPTWRDDAPALGFARLLKLRGLRQATLTVLDGTGRFRLARKLYGERLTETRVAFERQAHVIGTKGRSYSKASITAADRNGRTIGARVTSAAGLRGDLATIFARLPAGSVVCAPKPVEELLFDSGAVPRDTPSMHFGALRGRNTWESCPGGLFIGAENVAISDVEEMARAYMADDPEPFVSMARMDDLPKGWRYERQWAYRATRMRRMRDGSTSPVEVPVHPDPRVQDVLELIREDELMQAFDRLRPVWHRRQTALLNDLCMDVTYDAIYSHKHLVAGGNPTERALHATGILPHTAELSHRAHRAIFRSAKAAEHAKRNYPQTGIKSPLWDLGVVSFRLLGQRGPEAKATVDRTRWPDDAALIAAIEAFAGPLQSFQGVALRRGETPAVEPVMHPDAGWRTSEPRQSGRGAAPPSIMMHGPPDG